MKKLWTLFLVLVGMFLVSGCVTNLPTNSINLPLLGKNYRPQGTVQKVIEAPKQYSFLAEKDPTGNLVFTGYSILYDKGKPFFYPVEGVFFKRGKLLVFYFSNIGYSHINTDLRKVFDGRQIQMNLALCRKRPLHRTANLRAYLLSKDINLDDLPLIYRMARNSFMHSYLKTLDEKPVQLKDFKLYYAITSRIIDAKGDLNKLWQTIAEIESPEFKTAFKKMEESNFNEVRLYYFFMQQGKEKLKYCALEKKKFKANNTDALIEKIIKHGIKVYRDYSNNIVWKRKRKYFSMTTWIDKESQDVLKFNSQIEILYYIDYVNRIYSRRILAKLTPRIVYTIDAFDIKIPFITRMYLSGASNPYDPRIAAPPRKIPISTLYLHGKLIYKKRHPDYFVY